MHKGKEANNKQTNKQTNKLTIQCSRVTSLAFSITAYVVNLISEAIVSIATWNNIFKQLEKLLLVLVGADSCQCISYLNAMICLNKNNLQQPINVRLE